MTLATCCSTNELIHGWKNQSTHTHTFFSHFPRRKTFFFRIQSNKQKLTWFSWLSFLFGGFVGSGLKNADELFFLLIVPTHNDLSKRFLMFLINSSSVNNPFYVCFLSLLQNFLTIFLLAAADAIIKPRWHVYPKWRP